jgi:hypothetical protein
MNDAEGLETLQFAHSIHPINNWNRVLYVGMHWRTLIRWRGDFYMRYIETINPGFTCDVLEIDQSNINRLQEHCVKIGHDKRFGIRFFLGDIIEYVKTPIEEKYDCVIWWHGPEHLEKEVSLDVLRGFENICQGVSILGCPHGHDPWEDPDPEVKDKHFWDVYNEDFEQLGYQCINPKRNNRGFRNKSHRPEDDPSISAVRCYP